MEFSFLGFILYTAIIAVVGGFIGILVYRNNEKKMDARFDKIDEKYDEKLKHIVEDIKETLKKK
jgi:hypothetical protein